MMYLLLFVSSLAANGLFVACEFGLIYLRYARHGVALTESLQERFWTRHLLREVDRAPRTLRFGRSLFTLLAGIGILGITLGLFGNDQGSVLTDLGILLILLPAVASFYYLFGELLPRVLAIKYPLRALQVTAPFFFFGKLAIFPLSALMRRIRDVLLQIVHLDVGEDLNPLDAEVQIRALGEEGRDLTPTARKIIDKAVSLPGLVVADILLPRNQIRWLDVNETLADNLKEAREAGHTRYPIAEGDLDRSIGILHVKDLFRRSAAPTDLRLIARPIFTLGLEDSLEEALQRFLGLRLHMALVVDDFGGVVGLVTLEMVLEELVGEIQDEFDIEEELIVSLGTRRYRIAGLTPIHDVEEALKIDLEEEEVSTLGGLVTAELGRIPECGETVRARGLEIRVIEVDEKRVITVEVEIQVDTGEVEGNVVDSQSR